MRRLWILGCAGLVACDGAPVDRIGVPELRVADDMGTVVLAEWEPPAEAPDALALAWSRDGTAWARSPVEAGAPWRAVAFGLKPSTGYQFRLEGEWAGEAEIGAIVRLETEALPTTAPTLTMTEAEPQAGVVAVGVNSDRSGAAFFDGDGEVVWWWEVPNSELLLTRVLRSVDERSVLVSTFNSPDGEYEESELAIHRVAYDGRVLEVIATPGGHHDFTERDDGTLAWLSAETQQIGDVPINGDTLVERSPDGAERVVWNAWDTHTYDADDPRYDHDFLHANCVKYDDSTGRYWVSLRATGELVHLDPATGTVVGTLLGPNSDLELTSGEALAFQHCFTLTDGGFLIMDDRMRQDEVSRAVEFTTDVGAGTMAQTWEYASDQDLHLFGLGDALPAGDDVLMVWSSAGQLQRVDRAGVTSWRGTTGLGTYLGYGEYSTSTTVRP